MFSFFVQPLLHLIFEGKVDALLPRNDLFLWSTLVHCHSTASSGYHYLFSTHHSLRSRLLGHNIRISVCLYRSWTFIWIILKVLCINIWLSSSELVKWSHNYTTHTTQYRLWLPRDFSSTVQKQCQLWSTLTQKQSIWSQNLFHIRVQHAQIVLYAYFGPTWWELILYAFMFLICWGRQL